MYGEGLVVISLLLESDGTVSWTKRVNENALPIRRYRNNCFKYGKKLDPRANLKESQWPDESSFKM